MMYIMASLALQLAAAQPQLGDIKAMFANMPAEQQAALAEVNAMIEKMPVEERRGFLSSMQETFGYNRECSMFTCPAGKIPVQKEIVFRAPGQCQPWSGLADISKMI